MLVIAHRGASAAFPENSLAAFRGAVEQGADGVELDVRRTGDGALVVRHDGALPDGRALTEASRVDLPPGVPELAEALVVCEPLSLVNIEIKNRPGEPDFDAGEEIAHRVVALLEQRGELTGARNLVSSFHLPTLERVRELAPDVPTAWLLRSVEDAVEIVERAGRGGLAALHPHHTLLDRDFVHLAHGAGLVVNTWTCDDPQRVRWLAGLGVDGVITNVPDIALAALGRSAPRATRRRTP